MAEAQIQHDAAVSTGVRTRSRREDFIKTFLSNRLALFGLVIMAIFILMAVVPLWFVWTARASTVPINARFGLPAGRDTTANEPPQSIAWDPSHREAPADADDAIDRLERLADALGGPVHAGADGGADAADGVQREQ